MKRSLVAFAAAATLATTTLASSSGCYGSFPATRKIHSWNGSLTTNRFGQSAIMVGMIIIPVYGLGALVDILILNPIEFISGSSSAPE